MPRLATGVVNLGENLNLKLRWVQIWANSSSIMFEEKHPSF